MLTLFWSTIFSLTANKAANTVAEPLSQHQTGDICTSKGCMLAASKLFQTLDTTAKPCEDFHQFVCGQWDYHSEVYPTLENLAPFSAFIQLSETAFKRLKYSLADHPDKPENTLSNSRAVNTTKQIYRTCMDTQLSLSDKTSKQFWEALISLGSWPLLNTSWTDKGFDVTKLLIELEREFGVQVFLGLQVAANSSNADLFNLNLFPWLLGLTTLSAYGDHGLISEKKLAAYERFIVQTAKAIADDAQMSLNQINLLVDVQDLIEFENELLKISAWKTDRKPPFPDVTVKWTLEDLRRRMPHFDWEAYLRAVMPAEIFDMFKHGEPMRVMQPATLYSVLELAKEAKPRTVANYIMWRFIATSMIYADLTLEALYQEFDQVAMGNQWPATRWKLCLQWAIVSMPLGAAALYAHNFVDIITKNEFRKLLDDFVAELQENFIDRMVWMDKQTKQYAKEKIAVLRKQVGVGDEAITLSPKYLDAYYENLTINANDSGFDIWRILAAYYQKRMFYNLLRPVDKNEVGPNAFIAMARYNHQRNELSKVIPLELLQAPFFNHSYPNFVKYAAVGTVGREFFRAIDAEIGSSYLKDGSSKVWWTKDTTMMYSAQAQCQGKSFDPELSGSRGALSLAYSTYKRNLKSENLTNAEKTLPGLSEFNVEQLFFISYAWHLCYIRKRLPSSNIKRAAGNIPIEAYVNIPMRSNEHFNRAFNCPVTPERCRHIWY